MLKRDLLRHSIIFSVLAAIIIGLRVFIYTPYRVTEQDSNAYLAKNDLVLATRKQDIKRGDFVLYEVDGKDYVGRVIAQEKDQVTYMAVSYTHLTLPTICSV